MLKFKIFRGVKHSLKHELCCGPYFQCIRLSRWETDPLTLSQRDTVADVWATLTWSPHVSNPSPADLSQRRLIQFGLRPGFDLATVRRFPAFGGIGKPTGKLR